MKRKSLIGLLVLGLLAGVVSTNTAVAKKQPKLVTVAEDGTGDWGANQDPGLAPAGDEMGGDLVGAQIGMADKSTVNFIIQVNKLPAPGGTPEAMRYIWALTVDGEYAELDGKFRNYSRGACDPTAGSCPPPRDPGEGPFAVRGDCTQTESVTTCTEKGLVHAKFDVDAATITIPVPLEVLGARPGSKITMGSSSFSGLCGGPIIAIASTFTSTCPQGPNDTMLMTGTYVVPR